MNSLGVFLRRYRLFSLTLGAALVCLGLQLINLVTAAHVGLAVVALLVALRLCWEVIQDVRLGTYGVDILSITAIVAAILLRQYWAALAVALLFTLGKGLQDLALSRARRSVENRRRLTPKTALVIRKRKEIRVPVSELRIGEKIVIKTGDVVPVDVIVPESGEELSSGSTHNGDVITAKVVRDAEHSHYQQITKLMRSASASRSPYLRLSERFVLPFAFTAYAIAAAAWIVSGHAIRFLDVIIVATPGPLLFAAPIALAGGLASLGNLGIIVKTGSALEHTRDARTIAFNQAGTLTLGQPEVADITPRKGFGKDEILRLSASLAQNSNHALAAALTAYAQAQGVKLIKAKHVKEIAGQGIEAHLQGKDVALGSLRFLESLGVTGTPSAPKETASYLAINNQLACVVTFRDKTRPEAQAALTALKHRGIKKLLLLTGNGRKASQKLATSLGISEVHAEALPAEKLHILEAVPEKDRPLLFVGDGAQDAPLLASADVGVAVGSHSLAASASSASVLIIHPGLAHVALLYAGAKRTFKIAAQSIFIGVVLSLVLMAVYATGILPPLTGAIAQELVDMLVIASALRAVGSTE